MRTKWQGICVAAISLAWSLFQPWISLADESVVTEADLVSNVGVKSSDDCDGSCDASSESSCCGKSSGCCGCCCKCEPWVVARESMFCDGCCNLDCVSDLLSHECCRFKYSVTGGAHHWFHQSLRGAGGGYGIPGIRNTYFWYLNFDSEYKLDSGRKIGTHINMRLRETGNFRGFID